MVVVGSARAELSMHWEPQPLQAGGQGVSGDRSPTCHLCSYRWPPAGGRSRAPPHIQRRLSAWIREQAREQNKNIQVTSNNTMTLALGNYYQLYRGVCAADNSTKEALSW